MKPVEGFDQLQFAEKAFQPWQQYRGSLA